MRSKTSFFNPTLFKKNLARFWPLWGGASALGALAPLVVLTQLMEDGFRSHAGKGLEVTLLYYEGLSYIVPFVSLFYAALCALAVWHYLYNARSVGLLHSLPITRKGLFVTNFLSGMAMMLIPYAVVGGMAVLISLAAGVFEPVGVLVTILGVIGESLFYFAFATLVIFVTGNPFAFTAFYFIFQFFAFGAEWLVCELANQFYFGVEQTNRGVLNFLSPTVYLVDHVSTSSSYQTITTPDGWVDNGSLESVTLAGGWLIAVYALVGVVLLGCAWALYRRRRSESAGEVVAVGWMKPIFRYGVAFCAALAGGVLLYNLFFRRYSYIPARVLPMTLCMIIAGLVGYYIASMLLAKSLRIFKATGKGALATAAAAGVLCALIAADPFGVERWVPEAGELEDLTISISGMGYVYADLTDPADIEKVLDLHRAILADKDVLVDRANWQESRTAHVNLSYYDGTWTRRYYYLPAAATDLVSQQKTAALATDPAIQEANIFEAIRYENIAEARLVGGYIGDVYNAETNLVDGVDLTQAQARELEAAVKRDIQAGHFGKTMFLPDDETREQSVYYGSLQLNYNVTWEPDEYRSATHPDSRTVSFEISVYCTETLKALESMGVLDGTHRLLTESEFYAMNKSGWSDYEPYDSYYDEVVYPEEHIIYPGDSNFETAVVGVVG